MILQVNCELMPQNHRGKWSELNTF